MRSRKWSRLQHWYIHTCGSFHQVGARFVTVSIVTSVNVPSIILDCKCTFTVVLQIRMKSISPPSIGNYNNVNKWMYWVCAIINLMYSTCLTFPHSWPIHDLFMIQNGHCDNLFLFKTLFYLAFSSLSLSLLLWSVLRPVWFYFVLRSSDNNTLNDIQVCHCIRIFYWKIK